MRLNLEAVLDCVASRARSLPATLWGRYYQTRFIEEEPEAQTHGTGLPSLVLAHVLSATDDTALKSRKGKTTSLKL